MRLYVENHKKEKIYLSVNALSKRELVKKIGNRRFVIQGRVYDINNIIAEDESDNTVSGAIVGGLLGILGGPLGILIGAFGGGVIGNNMTTTESDQVANFNNSRI